MERPSSRGGAVQQGAARPSSRGGQYMAQGGVRPGTGMRPGTGARAALGSRQGTAARAAPNMAGVGMSAAMNISDRPVTQQGLSGMKTASGLGPSRQIQDNSYYLQLLRSKCSMIMGEISALKGNIEQSQKDNNAYGQLERKYESLTNEMRTLQGKLADYNLMLDRTRVNKESHDINAECAQLANANAAERHRVDEVFNHRQAVEGQGRDVEQQLHAHHVEMARRLDSIDPSMKDAFLKMQEEHRRLTVQDLPKKQADLHFFTERCNEMEQAVQRDEHRSTMYKIKDEIRRQEKHHHELSEELDGPQLSVPQQREMLLQKVKADNAEIAEMEKRLAEMQDAVRRGRAQLTQLASEASEANDPKAQKYQELFQRDKEMSELIDTFEEKKEEELRKTAAAQKEIVRVLQSISRKTDFLENTGSLSTQKLSEVKAELDFKQTQMDNSATTSNKLGSELEKRKVELEKINTLEQKISVELAQLNDKMVTMKKELEMFRDIDRLKRDAAESRSELARSLESARAGIGVSAQKGQKNKQRHEEMKAALAGDSTAIALDELEQKMRHLEQTVYVLSEYIDTKGAETMFQPVADDCMNMLNNINNETISVLAEQPVFTVQPAAY